MYSVVMRLVLVMIPFRETPGSSRDESRDLLDEIFRVGGAFARFSLGDR